ncbi:MAG: BamA/TamA family outer membrane protein [Paludibacteraceae bacterium]|nr:BamA/TamA family outer membrane protein [Paludibacteraceae bacterium]
MKRVFSLISTIIALLCIASCSTTKYVADGDYLLNDINVKCDNPEIDATDLYDYVIQQPNTPGTFFNKTSLRFYSLSGRDTSKWINKLIRRFGEPPVIYSEEYTQLSAKEIKSQLFNMGYFTADVNYDVSKKGKKASVVYDIKAGEPYKIHNVDETIDGGLIDDILHSKNFISNDKVKEGAIYNAENIDSRVGDIVSFVRNQGYYNFTKENLYYSVDSTLGTHQVDLKLNLHVDTSRVGHPLTRYRTSKVMVTMGDYRGYSGEYAGVSDTTQYKRLTIIFPKGRRFLRPSTIYNNTFVRDGRLYSELLHDRTFSALSGLSAVQTANVTYTPDTAPGSLIANISVTPAKPYYIQWGIDNTNTAGDLGVETYVTYQDKNIFKGSEIWRIRLGGAYEMVRGAIEKGFDSKNFFEFSINSSLAFPRVLSPIFNDSYAAKKGKTVFSTGFVWQNRPEFKKRYLTFDWKYMWSTRRNRYSHTLDLYNITYTIVPWILPDFQTKYLDVSTTALLKQNYTNQFITRSSYTFSYSSSSATASSLMKAKKTSKSSTNFSFTIDMSGTLPSGLVRLFNSPVKEETTDSFGTVHKYYEIFGVPFSQYARFDVDYSRTFRLGIHPELALHVGAGIACPYGNSKQIPYERRYFAGGPNSVRGWSTRELGPGRYVRKGPADFFNQTGDVKLLAQAELRFHTEGIFEYAIFVDAGNVWTIQDYENQPGGKIVLNELPKDLAASVGAGVRLDLSFILVRLDIGMKGYDPSTREWNITSPKFKRDVTLHFAIGYPF